MTDLSDIEATAADYVVGTLDAAGRVAVEARRQREPALEAAIAAWERQLAPLADMAAPVAPPSAVFDNIVKRLESAHAPASAPDLTNVITLQQSRNRWRMAAISSFALAAASLVAAIGLLQTIPRQTIPVPPVAPQNYVAVFQKDNTSPAFVLTLDLTTRTAMVRRVAAEIPAGKAYELWIAAASLGPGMHSLGLVGSGNAGLQKAIARIDPGVVQHATFGVSLEPEGGSPTGQPTGPAFVTTLIPTGP